MKISEFVDKLSKNKDVLYLEMKDNMDTNMESSMNEKKNTSTCKESNNMDKSSNNADKSSNSADKSSDSADKGSNITDKNINDVIEKSVNKQDRSCKWKINKVDLQKTFDEHGMQNGSILIFTENEDSFIYDYQRNVQSNAIKFMTDKGYQKLYISKDYTYENLLNFCKCLYMNQEIEIPFFEKDIEYNKIKKIMIKMKKNCKFVTFACGIQKEDSNKITHVHEIVCDSMKIKNLYKKISNLDCVKRRLVYKNDEFYNKDGVKEEIAIKKVVKDDKNDKNVSVINDTFNKKVYDTLKTNCRIVEMFYGNPYIKNYEFSDEMIGDGFLILKNTLEEGQKEVVLIGYNGKVFEDYPIVLCVNQNETLGMLRRKYKLLFRICKFDGDGFKNIEDDERIDRFDKNDVLVILKN